MTGGHGTGKPKLLGSHQKCWIWGRHAVTETLRAGKWLPLDLLLADSLDARNRAELVELAQKRDVPIETESPARLQQLCKADDHQGCIARMPEFPYDDPAELLKARPETPAYLVLDGVQDPHNLGAILRSAEVFGVHAVFLASSGQVGVTSLVARTSAGAVNHLPIARVQELATFIDELRLDGIAVVATHQTATTPVHTVDFRRPVTFLIGNESRGLSDSLRERCNVEVAIPQFGRIDSLNAAVAAGVVLYEIARQRHC